jgi:hypothetical protein
MQMYVGASVGRCIDGDGAPVGGVGSDEDQVAIVRRTPIDGINEA